MIKRIYDYLGGYKRQVFLCLLFVTSAVVCEMIIPRLMANIIDIGIANGDMTYILKTGGLMVVLAGVGILLGYFNIRLSSIAAPGLSYNLREALFEKVSQFSFKNIDKFSTASLTTRLTNDVNTIQMTLIMGLRMFVRAPLTLIVALFMVLRINARLSLIVLGAIPLLALSLILVLKGIPALFSEVQKRLDRLNLTVQENITGIRVVKSFVREDHEKEKFKAANDDLTNIAVSASGRAMLTMPAMMMVMNLAVVAVLWFGGQMVFGGVLLSGDLISFISYITQILMSLVMVSALFIMSSRAKASIQRVVEVLDEVPAVDESPEGGRTEPITRGKVEFSNVSFKYDTSGSGHDVLKNISFTADPGEVVAIVGGTGTGKSSLVNLIPRFYDVTEGEIKVDGVNVREYNAHALRERIGMVLQSNTLFTGTIRENLLWGNEDSTAEDLELACKSAQAHDFIMSFPDGYDTVVAQGGTNLSGGQKQRLCIARAMLKKPIILILDDSTSAVDSTTEAEIRKSFREGLSGTTVFIISQRISSVKDADGILVLDNGQVAGFGTHDQLMAENNIYQEIYNSQNQGGES